MSNNRALASVKLGRLHILLTLLHICGPRQPRAGRNLILIARSQLNALATRPTETDLVPYADRRKVVLLKTYLYVLKTIAEPGTAS